MQHSKIIFITHDALHRNYLPTYGNSYWKTPNIDALAKKGTIFQKYYTGAPSTIMSNMCMFTGLEAYQSELSDYGYTHKRYQGTTLFDHAKSLGYSCHIIWDEAWNSIAHSVDIYYCYGEDTRFHFLDGFRQGVGSHYVHKGFLQPDQEKTQHAYDMVEETLSNITQEDNVFVWLHVPHVINGRTGYGQDIDAFDHIVGIAREYFSDDDIFISADHGNMNGERNKVGYGFDVYECAIKIPLITPRIDNKAISDDLLSNVDLSSILFQRKIPRKEYVLSDSAFYAQPNRKLAIIGPRFKYIYNKHDHSEELYDLDFDPNESCNIMNDFIVDSDRQVKSPLRELYFYPYWEEAEKQREYFRKIKEEIWKEGTWKEEFLPTLKYKFKIHIYYKIKKWVVKIKQKRAAHSSS